MRIGIISDIHSNVYGLKSVLKRLERMDLVLCAGDITGYYPFVNDVFQELESNSVIFIKGNHDAYLCDDRAEDLGPAALEAFEYTKNNITSANLARLRKASVHLECNHDGLRLVMFHGSPWDHLEQYIYPDYSGFARFGELDADVIILGHTHHPMTKQVGEKLVINPGSCGQPRDYDPRASFAVFDTSTRQARIERVAYDVEKVSGEIRKLGFDSSLSAILARVR